MPRPDPAAQALADLMPLVRAILARKSGMSLAAIDSRHENVEALELAQEVQARLWERLAGGGELPADPRAYAASVTHNAWSDHLRRKYPRRTRLKNRLRYFLGHQPAFALWPDGDGDWLAGRHGWRLQPPAVAERGAWSALAQRPSLLPRGSLPRAAADDLDSAAWARLLDGVFGHLAAPLRLDDLVSLCTQLLGVREDETESFDGADDEDEGRPADALAAASHLQPEAVAATRSLLRQLWAAVLALKPDYRRAYLLNLPGPGKLRADLEVFVMHGVASIGDIASALALDDRQYQQLFGSIALDPDERVELERCHSSHERFCLLWRHLPLADAAIGAVLALEPQQVINRRMLALRELARLVGHHRPRSA